MLFCLKIWTGQFILKKGRDCSIDDVIVYGRNELWVIKSTWSSVELNRYCVYLFWLNPDVSLTVKHYSHQPSLLTYPTLPSPALLQNLDLLRITSYWSHKNNHNCPQNLQLLLCNHS